MTATPASGPSPASRKIRWFGIAVIVIGALYSAGWYYVASKIDHFLGDMIKGSHVGRMQLQCDHLKTGGFPLLFSVSCRSADVTDTRTGNMLLSSNIDAAARIYNPGTAAIELTSPASLSLGNGTLLKGNWQQLNILLGANFRGLSSLSADGAALDLLLGSPDLAELLNLKASAAHLALQNDAGNLNIKLNIDDFRLNEQAEDLLPKLTGSLDLTLNDKGKVLERQPFGSKKMSGTLTRFTLASERGLLTGELSGPFTIDDDGLISGTFRLKLKNLDLWQQHLTSIFPDAHDMIAGFAKVLKGFAKGKDEVSVKLKVNDGKISLSFIPLGKLPPI